MWDVKIGEQKGEEKTEGLLPEWLRENGSGTQTSLTRFTGIRIKKNALLCQKAGQI
jgi:hypothetical protein